jgi:hypothetical protein
MVFTGAAVKSLARKNSARATASRWSELTRTLESAIARHDRAGIHERGEQPM